MRRGQINSNVLVIVAAIAFTAAALGIPAVNNWTKPEPAPVVVPVVPTPAPPLAEPAMVIVLDANGVRIDNKEIEEAAKILAKELAVWTVEFIPTPGQKGTRRTLSVTDGVNPIPVPPTPTPPVPPTPTPPTPNPIPPPPAPDPSHPLAKFRTQPMAAEVGQAHRIFSDALKQFPLSTIGEFKLKLQEFHVLMWSDQPNAMPGFSAAFEQAFQAVFGQSDGPLDPAKAQSFLEAAAAALGG